jgi:hypothetical protein
VIGGLVQDPFKQFDRLGSVTELTVAVCHVAECDHAVRVAGGDTKEQ